MRNDLPNGNLSLLLTDIEGSTRLLHRLGAEGYARAQADHRDLLRTAFSASNGVEVDTQGDAFFYVFPTALDCLKGAVAGQRSLAGFAWTHNEPVKVRMGIHSGTPQRTDEGYVGIAVNLAARIASAGHGGQILISQDAAEDLTSALESDELSLRDLGEYRLKDMETPARVFQAVIPELPSDFSPPRTAATRPNNLPVALTPFIGRAKAVVDVRDMLLRDDIRAVTLLGPGGTGKSRLGLRVASEMLHSLEDGAFFVALAPIRDSDLVPGAIAATLGIREEPNESIGDTLVSFLQTKELLLLLDNFEQVQSAARFVAEVLRLCPGIKVLATSREPLRISGERGFRVPPLQLPSEDAELSPDEVGKFEAVRLFVDRAQAAQWDFELSNENVKDVVEICRRVDALPLAIELATARLYEMTPQQLLAALSERLNVLTEGAVDLLDHQRTLRDLIAWSYELLDPQLQTLWQRLAVFHGGWTLEAGQIVCDVEERGQIQHDIDSLIQKSLVTLAVGSASRADKVVAGSATSQRYTMLETLREFAEDVLEQSAEVSRIRQRFHQCFLQLAETSKSKLRGPESAQWLAELHPDIANFRAVMNQCTSEAPVDSETALRLGAALWFFWYSLGYMTEGREHLSHAVAIGQDASTKARADALLAIATIARQQNRIEDALQAGEEALELYRLDLDEAGIPAALSELGAIAQRQEDYERADVLLTEAVERLRLEGSDERLAVALNLLGIVDQLRNNLDSARSSYRESLALGREIGDQNVIGTALVNLGEIAELSGDIEEATDWYRQSLTVWAELNQGLAIVYCLEVLAGIDASAGRGEEAAVLFGAAARIREEQEIPVESYNLARYERNIGLAQTAIGDASFDETWQLGCRLALAEVIELAMVDEGSGITTHSS